jgi:hypothetical protein
MDSNQEDIVKICMKINDVTAGLDCSQVMNALAATILDLLMEIPKTHAQETLDVLVDGLQYNFEKLPEEMFKGNESHVN